MIPQRKLGAELQVSCLGLGCMGMSQSYGVPNDQESLETLKRALELGVNFLDTAEVYGPYTNEELVGRFLKTCREKVILATKFGVKIENSKLVGVISRPDHIRRAVDGSLKRLGTSYIDLLFQHRVDPEVPIEEVVGVMAELVREGKVRYLGLSEAGCETIKRAHAVHPIAALQSEYSLWERNLEAEILPLIRSLGIGLVAFSPLGRGFLTKEAKRAEEYPESDYRRSDPRFQGTNFDANMKLVKVVSDLAEKKKATSSQIALAWLLHKGDDIVPIPGTKRRTYLEENVAACKIILTPDEIQLLDTMLAPGVTSGERYGKFHMSFIDR